MVVRRLAATLLFAGLLATGTTLWLQGYRMYVVHTGSMSPHIRPGDLVVDRPVHEVRRGQVITFRHSNLTTDVVTHRVVGTSPDGLIRTKGDANATADAWQIRPDQVRGEVISRLPGAGYLAVFLRQPTGLAAVATSAITLVLLWGLFFPAAPAATHTATTGARAERPRVPRDRGHMIRPRTS